MNSKKIKESSFVVTIIFIATILFFFIGYIENPDKGETDLGINRLSAEDQLAGIIKNDSRVQKLIMDSYIPLGGIFNETGESTE